MTQKIFIYFIAIAAVGLVSYVIIDEQKGSRTATEEQELSEEGAAMIQEAAAVLDMFAASAEAQISGDLSELEAKKLEAEKSDAGKEAERQRQAEKMIEQGVTPGSVSDFNPR